MNASKARHQVAHRSKVGTPARENFHHLTLLTVQERFGLLSNDNEPAAMQSREYGSADLTCTMDQFLRWPRSWTIRRIVPKFFTAAMMLSIGKGWASSQMDQKPNESVSGTIPASLETATAATSGAQRLVPVINKQ